jgi:hypothetical protein
MSCPEAEGYISHRTSASRKALVVLKYRVWWNVRKEGNDRYWKADQAEVRLRVWTWTGAELRVCMHVSRTPPPPKMRSDLVCKPKMYPDTV